MLTLRSKSASKPGSASCTLTSAELQAYPDSLLSSFVAACATSNGAAGDDSADGSSSSTVSINLEDVPGWPSGLLKPVEAAEVIPALYRWASLAGIACCSSLTDVICAQKYRPAAVLAPAL
jgi:hypothetical protein